ncbi:hypothetical protein M0802_013532 [Mischocyttarus mexicanus]|nr:hypothetical protein M0802_013532 [Mischocyttarus mexicanus]
MNAPPAGVKAAQVDQSPPEICRLCNTDEHKTKDCPKLNTPALMPINYTRPGDEFFALTNADVRNGKRCLEFQNMCAALQEDESIIKGARETRKVEVFISTPQVEVGILERREPAKGVYFEEVVVRPEKGKATIDVVNGTDNLIVMKIPTISIIPLKERVNPVVGDLGGGGITPGVNSRAKEPTMGDKLSDDGEIGALGTVKCVDSYENEKEINEDIYESCEDKVDEKEINNNCYKKKIVGEEKVNNEKINKVNKDNCEYEVGERGINNEKIIEVTIDENLGEPLKRLFDCNERIDKEIYDEEIDTIANEEIGDEVTYTDFCNVITEVAADRSFNSVKGPDIQIDLRKFSDSHYIKDNEVSNGIRSLVFYNQPVLVPTARKDRLLSLLRLDNLGVEEKLQMPADRARNGNGVHEEEPNRRRRWYTKQLQMIQYPHLFRPYQRGFDLQEGPSTKEKNPPSTPENSVEQDQLEEKVGVSSTIEDSDECNFSNLLAAIADDLSKPYEYQEDDSDEMLPDYEDEIPLSNDELVTSTVQETYPLNEDEIK